MVSLTTLVLQEIYGLWVASTTFPSIIDQKSARLCFRRSQNPLQALATLPICKTLDLPLESILRQPPLALPRSLRRLLCRPRLSGACTCLGICLGGIAHMMLASEPNAPKN
jgi:hypothetical protein